MNYPANIWLIQESEFDNFTFTGGKVIYIVEDAAMMYKTHPAIITAGALLPPMEALQAELGGDIAQASMIYASYLMSQEAAMYVSIILAAAIKQIPIGIMFGPDELNMQFPKMFMEYLFSNFGLVVGVQNRVNPYIVYEALPFTLANLYCMNLIDYPTYLEKHPSNLPINQMAISKLAIDVNPLVGERSFESYMKYFENAKNVTQKFGRFAEDPLEAI